MGFVLLDVSITDNANIIVDVEAEQWTTLASGLGNNEVIERRMMGDDEVLFDIHQLVNGRQLQFIELATQLLKAALQELMDAVTFAHADLSTMARAVPVTVRYVNFLRLYLLLLCSPLLPQLLPVTSHTTKNARFIIT